MFRHLGQTLRETREAADKTLRDVSIASGVTESNLGRFERGTTSPPRRLDAIMEGYSAVLGVPEIELYRMALERMSATQAAAALTAARRARSQSRAPSSTRKPRA